MALSVSDFCAKLVVGVVESEVVGVAFPVLTSRALQNESSMTFNLCTQLRFTVVLEYFVNFCYYCWLVKGCKNTPFDYCDSD